MKDLAFDLKDIEVFKIPDPKTRLNILQKYFFPRLEILMDSALSLVQEVYEINPYENTSSSYRPRHRQSAKVNIDRWGDVYLGISGKRKPGINTTIKNKHGKPYSYYYGNLAFRLAFRINSDGCMYTELFGCDFNARHNIKFLEDVKHVFDENHQALQALMMLNHVSFSSSLQFVSFQKWIDQKVEELVSEDENLNIGFYSDLCYFPLEFDRGLKRLNLAFVAIYPVFEVIRCLQQGQVLDEVNEIMMNMLSRYESWVHSGGYHNAFYGNTYLDDVSSEAEDYASYDLELDNYAFTRAGLWWDVLARDKWTCRSCGRSTRVDGITLHVDHILPRSQGGMDQISNLQTLCAKCNLGKSNRDTTDLRSVLPEKD
ncbi:MAG: HNH endonuclease [Tildeniella torsiva UHER 1998/13D]|jgi:hypothetical protein|nr:HNH endonuclease [Tildeniella torsiva UHER 1998/13D]